MIYQVQENDEKGTLIAPTVEGNLIMGPTSENVSSYENTDTTRAGLDHVERVAKNSSRSGYGKGHYEFCGNPGGNITNIDKGTEGFRDPNERKAHGQRSRH